MQVCTSLQTDNHANTPTLFLQAGCPSCRPTNSVKALKAEEMENCISYLYLLLQKYSVNCKSTASRSFGVWTQIGPRNRILCGAQITQPRPKSDPTREGALLVTYMGMSWLARGDILYIMKRYLHGVKQVLVGNRCTN